ncbi:hypothetical protein Cgig2_008753 [Carnegiea gigantea]|uniref:Uncharacterized protein n=1 Tax=Carnegiea gigantea TaxID=171969 RepID=A0A9Q1JLS6_9CARY|nr:hypothetical protein Cgig2_008753 [Carnegiea gigantea]
MVHFLNFTSTKMAVEYVRETFQWPLRETSAERPRPVPEDHFILCPSFDLGDLLRNGRERGCGAGYHVQNLGEVLDVGPVARIGRPRITLQAVGISTIKKSPSRFLDLSLSPKRTERRIIPVRFTSCPPKPKMGCIKVTMSHPRCVNFFKQSQVMMSIELPVSIRIHRTIALAIFISMTKGSLCGEANRGASFPPNTIVGTVVRAPCVVVSTCCALLS